jgi:hypothetical protein
MNECRSLKWTQNQMQERLTVHDACKNVSSIYYMLSTSKCDTQNIMNLTLFHLKHKAEAKQLAITHQ